MVLKQLTGFSELPEANQVIADINSRRGGASIIELAANASIERGGPKAPAANN
jgi:hypothetical protein